jgi:spermidine/putrescine-binding protein
MSAFTDFAACKMPGAMADWFQWWSDPTGLDRAQVVLGALGLLVAIGLGIVAWWLAREQVKIADRQKDMQEEQHKFFSEQLAKKTDLRIIVPGVSNNYKHTLGADAALEERTTVKFNAHNGGTKSADGFYWEILVPENIAHWFTFIDSDGEEVESKISHQSATEHYTED